MPLDMQLFAQTALTGLLLGGVYGLVAMGLSLIFGVMRVINFAHGSIVLVGMYLVYSLYNAGVNPFVALLIAVPLGLLFGALLQTVLLGPVTGKDELRQLLLTLGLSLIIKSIAQVIFSPNSLSLSGFTAGSTLVDIGGGLYVKPAHIIGFAIAILVAAMLVLILRYTDLGRRMRAVVDDSQMAESAGVRSKRIYTISMAIGICIAIVAGGVLVTYQPVSPTTGDAFLVIAFVAVVLGGLSSVYGAFVGGVIAGVVQQLTSAFVGPALQDAGLFVIFILVLIFRPNGLFGRKGDVA
ncbi:branched-chain amino acid ABC transporter permease [Compostimonas suwonensis]|uniref:branched-chain amino acid ABC transporter permease n=1 Tax=Compostimonas suwonensis TaxID=1048394 RepID=UPI0012FE1BBD|nr:branched-chain amino acid ABC transporter permease [Compostimonas suwonensis]